MKNTGGRKLSVSALGLLGAVFWVSTVLADDQETVDYREHIMKTMAEQVGAMNQMRQGKIGADNLAVHAEILAVAAATAKSAFMPKAVAGKAKADVWANWQDFARRLDELVAQTSDLSKAAKDGGLAAATPKLQGLTCKGCHDIYREETK